MQRAPSHCPSDAARVLGGGCDGDGDGDGDSQNMKDLGPTVKVGIGPTRAAGVLAFFLAGDWAPHQILRFFLAGDWAPHPRRTL